jgi:O-antigen/teichoic acid export membrane protein
MNPQYRELIKHSGVYALGTILTRIVSVVMLPINTRFLTPADYGTIAILDLTAAILGIVFAGGMTSALGRFHHDGDTDEHRNTVWWTGLTMVAAMTAVFVLPALLFREWLARVTLGAETADGGLYYALVLSTLWFSVIINVAALYLRVRKWSWSAVILALITLVINVLLNIYFLTRGWGITGILAGNLITLVGMSVVRLAIVMRYCGPFRFDNAIGWEMLRFGAPIMIIALLGTAMQQSDRYLVRKYVDLGSVGMYYLAYQLGQGINSLVLAPFGMIWGTVMFDIAREPDHKTTFARIFEYYFYGVLLLMLGVSLFIEPIIRVFATADYLGAAPLVPIVCLALVFSSLDMHFKVPAMLAKRTLGLLPPTLAGVAVSIGLNIWLLPIFGVLAAAWVSVASYTVFAGATLLQARRIDEYHYPLVRCGMVLLAMVASYVACTYVGRAGVAPAISVGLPLVVWLAWAGALTYPLFKRFGRPTLVAAGWS